MQVDHRRERIGERLLGIRTPCVAVFCLLGAFFGACSGSSVEPDSYEPDDSIDDAGVISVGELQFRTLHDEDDVDYVRVHGVAGASYSAYTQLIDGGPDTILSLFGDDGTFLMSNDDVGSGTEEGDLSSRLSWNSPTEADYYLLVEAYSGPGSYWLGLELSDLLDAFEPDDTIDQANVIALGESQDHSCHGTEDVDFLTFEVEPGILYRLATEVEDGEDTDTDLTVFNSNGVELFYSDDVDSVTYDASLTFLTNVEGWYYAQVGCLHTGPYVVALSEEVLEGPDDQVILEPDAFEPDNSRDSASVLVVDKVQAHSLHTGTDVDYARFEGEAGTTYAIETAIPEGEATDAVLRLEDADGGLLDQDDGGAEHGDRIVVTVSADGFFYAVVEAADRSSYGDYELKLSRIAFETPSPSPTPADEPSPSPEPGGGPSPASSPEPVSTPSAASPSPTPATSTPGDASPTPEDASPTPGP